MIISDFQECVALMQIDPELKRALRTNERVPLFVDNLVREVKACERVMFMKGKRLDRKKIKDMVYSMTTIFCKGLEAKAQAAYASEMEKIRQQQLEAERNKLDKDGNADLTEEFGVLIKDAEEPSDKAKKKTRSTDEVQA